MPVHEGDTFSHEYLPQYWEEGAEGRHAVPIHHRHHRHVVHLRRAQVDHERTGIILTEESRSVGKCIRFTALSPSRTTRDLSAKCPPGIDIWMHDSRRLNMQMRVVTHSESKNLKL